jgi:phosphoglycolate phosphatase
MHGAALEPYTQEILAYLADHSITLSVLTNNAHEAALLALQELGIDHWFALIAGREQMRALKPSPSGITYILQHFPQITPGSWMMIGDSWIDGMAAQRAGIPFLAYKGDLEGMQRQGVHPLGNLQTLRQLKEWIPESR